MKIQFLTLIALLCNALIFAQDESNFKNYNWDEHSIEKFDVSKHQNEEVVAIKEKEIHDFVIVNQNNFIEYKLIHNILWLNSNDKIEDYNKVYLPIYSNSQLVSSKARVITASKKIIELDASKILEAKDEETKVTYKYFALEGVEKGAFIEYFYITKNTPKYTGNRVALQADYNKYNVDFELIAPRNLEFKFKTYNGLPEIKKDTTIADKNHWKLHLDTLSALEPEEKAPYTTLLKQVVYKLYKNVDNPTVSFFDYAKFGQNSYKNIYLPLDKASNKAIKKFIAELGIKPSLSKIEKFRIIESNLKTSFYVTPQSAEEVETTTSILKNKISSEYGMIKLYAALMTYLDIENQLVFTSNRTQQKFDPEFEAYNFISDYLFYLVDEKIYLDPLDIGSRLGFPNGYLTDNYGVFVEPIKLGDFASGNAKIKYIEPVDYKKSTDSLFVKIKTTAENLNTVNLEFEQRFTGYKAIYIQPYVHLSPKDSREELLKNIITQYYPNAKIDNAVFENGEKSDFGNLPLIVKADVTSDNYINKAGRKYLFKIGELIGPQLEMYQDKKRTLDTEDRNKKFYYRELRFKIPEGYNAKNLESLVLDESYLDESGNTLFLFKSHYEINEGILVVFIDEYYNQNIIPPAIYEAYRKVINSAADFNKATIILEKK